MLTKFIEAHVVEQLTVIAGAVAVVLWLALLRLKLRDIRENDQNGPVQFMLNDNRTLGIIMLSMSAGALFIGIVALNMRPDAHEYEYMSQSFVAMLFTGLEAIGFSILAGYRFRRRQKLPHLIEEQRAMKAAMEEQIPGGTRKLDPPEFS